MNSLCFQPNFSSITSSFVVKGLATAAAGLAFVPAVLAQDETAGGESSFLGTWLLPAVFTTIILIATACIFSRRSGSSSQDKYYRERDFLDAGHNGDVKALEKFLAEGMPIETANCRGHTALFTACIGGKLATVQILVEGDANKDRLDSEKHSPLYWAAFKGHTHIVRYLLNQGAEKPSSAEIHELVNLPNNRENREMLDLLLQG